MLYNERITTDASQGVKIYEGNQGQAMMKEGAAVKQQAAREMQQAKELEEKSYKLSMVKGMNELWQNEQLSSNPQALASEMDKLSEKVTSDISDMDMRVNVLTDFELKKDSYINQATTKMNRIQEEKARSAAFDAIYANIDSLSRAFGNGVSGNYNDGDVVNYQYSLDRIKANINARNPDGTYMFSDSQRRAMAKEVEKAQLTSFKMTFDDMPDKERARVADLIKGDNYYIQTSEDSSMNLRDIVGDEQYNNIKDYVKEDEYRKVALEEKKIKLEKSMEKVKQYNTEMELSDQLDDMDALDALKILDDKENDVSKEYYKAKKKALLSSKGIDAETQAETANEIILDIAAIKPENAKDFFKQSNTVLTKIENSYANGELDYKDKKTLTRQLMKRQGKNLPVLIDEESHWYKIYDLSDAKEDFDKGLFNSSNSNNAMLEYVRTIDNEKYAQNPKERKNLVKILISQYNSVRTPQSVTKVGRFTVRVK